MRGRAESFTCDRCYGRYAATRRNAVAYVYFADHRCNHLVASCALCGLRETIFLGPDVMRQAIVGGSLPVVYAAHADGDMRTRAERAWGAKATAPPPVAPPLPSYELTPRLQAEADRFAAALDTTPPEWLWDALLEDPAGDLPVRWVD